MAVVAIAAILTTIAVPRFAHIMRNNEIHATATQIADGLHLARTEAVRRNTLVSFTLIPGEEFPGWKVEKVSDATMIQTYLPQRSGVLVSVVAKPVAANSIIFNAFGAVAPDAVDHPPIRQLAINSTHAGNTSSLQININEMGVIRVCDPSLSVAGAVPPNPMACS